MTPEEMQDVVSQITYKEGYTLLLRQDVAADPGDAEAAAASVMLRVLTGHEVDTEVMKQVLLTGTKPPRWYLQVMFARVDVVTGEPGVGYSGKSYVSEHMVLSEFVRACFGVFDRLEEHEAREAFQWEGKRVFGPHVDIRALHEVARRVEHRKPMVDTPSASATPASPNWGFLDRAEFRR